MRPHHTKNKGDLGVLHAKVDLAEKGYRLLLPLSEHEPFDLVAYRDETFLRVQVRYRTAVNGLLWIRFQTSWADRHGTHTLKLDKRAVDVFCVYCPDTRTCYYVDPRDGETGVTLRLNAPLNFQKKGVRWAKDFTEIPTTVRGVSRRA